MELWKQQLKVQWNKVCWDVTNPGEVEEVFGVFLGLEILDW
jgi:hypothetical protein